MGTSRSPGSLSIQQKFPFEIPEIPRAQWNGTFRLNRPDPSHLAWESSQHFKTPPLVSPRNDLWETCAEILYWWRVTTKIWVVLLIDRAAREICFSQSETLSRSGWWHFICKEFLRSFLRRHFAGKPVVASWYVGCFLRLKPPRV